MKVADRFISARQQKHARAFKGNAPAPAHNNVSFPSGRMPESDELARRTRNSIFEFAALIDIPPPRSMDDSQDGGADRRGKKKK